VDPDSKSDRTKPGHAKDWRELCTEAATELDPVKLMNLIAELTRVLNERNQNGQRTAGEDTRNSTSIPLHRGLAV
jgi:hypothetical protein